MDDGDDAGGDEAGGGGVPNFIGNDALGEGSTTRTRAPNDELPYDEDDDTSFCFPSVYQPDDNDTSIAGTELKQAYREMHALIDRHFANNTSMADLTRHVQDFYVQHIQSHWSYGEWSRKSIMRYIMQYSNQSEERQIVEGIKVIWSQVEFLRENVAVRDESTGKVTPDTRTIKMLADLVRLHGNLVTERRKRPRHAQ